MSVQNRIVKVQKRNRALVRFDESRIWKAILRAAESIGGFRQDFLPGVNDKVFDAYGNDEHIAGFLADAVVICLNSAFITFPISPRKPASAAAETHICR